MNDRIRLVPIPAQAAPIGQPEGRSGYTEAQKEAAYLVWSTSGQRSARETERLTNIPRSTIDRWAKDWKAEAAKQDEQDRKRVRGVADALITSRLPAVLERVWLMIENEKTSAAVRSELLRWWAGTAGISPVTKSVALSPDEVDTGVDTAELYRLARSGKPEDLQRLVALSTDQPNAGAA